MGVGKTLTIISAIWALLRRGGRKCLVICPSSLVDNWLKEIKHWLGTRVKPLSVKAGADAAAIINTFAISLPSLYPLMVLSYEVSCAMVVYIYCTGLYTIYTQYILKYIYNH